MIRLSCVLIIFINYLFLHMSINSTLQNSRMNFDINFSFMGAE